ncbi:DUF3828 domain-containing protein [Cronobacter sakazakii]|uniref:DUF3828 domain-containing protein n=1 Tax=Cronobacter sakazakii TaxID=28141 RepID=UPI000CFE2728|nr:DUF3828 domain-containing protein [Cronobacter sakazakii]EJP5808342.1 DUF3828 domain-containing protein [Cronobacter sakazakii]EJX4166307.1 DUF3828 domain-containing protein [Cronobacter sakazakii]EJY8354752.1 DUF3828 domain-containing protein [Cronobacter sakazakii]EJY8374906.1 DUF3828 domain-containing protein [Cronobacter sakazakii]EKC5755917.1 DUF3828 domain-containing protein [Cronobacter sakazakii]
MNKTICTLLITAALCSTTAVASDETLEQKPQQAALNFNRWYISGFQNTHQDLLDSKQIRHYVTKTTLEKLRRARPNENEFYDADFFIKAQDILPDGTSHIVITDVEYDPVCTQVYVSFGQNPAHGVIDCMVKEAGIWKVQSVARVPVAKGKP